MPKDPYLKFLDCAKGLYLQGLKLIDPKKDDYSILSGCILLIVGLEKLMKHALKLKNPLLILEKVSFDLLIKLEKDKEGFYNFYTAHLTDIFKRLVSIYPKLERESMHIVRIAKYRGFLLHNEGYYNLSKIEESVRVNITDITEVVCLECLGVEPSKLFTKKIWKEMTNYRDAYKAAEALKLEKRIVFLKRLYKQGKKLPCEIIKELGELFYECPICDEDLEVGLNVDVDFDRFGNCEGAYTYPDFVKCNNCGFTLSDPNEIETLYGKDTIYEFIRDREYVEYPHMVDYI